MLLSDFDASLEQVYLLLELLRAVSIQMQKFPRTELGGEPNDSLRKWIALFLHREVLQTTRTILVSLESLEAILIILEAGDPNRIKAADGGIGFGLHS